MNSVCGSAGCIGSANAAAIFVIVMGMWALGYGMGKAVAWTRALCGAA